MSVVLEPIAEFYRVVLNPMQPFTGLAGMPVSLLDIAACFRLCMALRQIREGLRAKHDERVAAGVEVRKVEERSFVREALATLVVVYGGEAITAPYLQEIPSFMVSGAFPLLYVVMQAWVEVMQNVPPMSLGSELPLALVDGMTRAYLLCSLIPPAVVGHSSAAISESPWTLLLSSLIVANGGFLLINMFNLLHPYEIFLSTPPELQPYGWTTTDIWIAPLITGLYATLTHAQPYWSALHYSALGWTGAVSVGENGVASIAAVDPEIARAACAVILAGVFSVRTYKNFAAVGAQKKPQKASVSAPSEKVKTQ
ncbi:hypothetical protein PsYK624_040940 [Phanerochaete sordida]|uniref:Uncharacterized protein n=1 Tax=Phanerochaete sordida TaxID=48140 RepID=A0A9P3G4A0_9APHY|nr:hypothetical protein PsYK624_040940 [Phanerochaete sordida]